ncbi:bifunctional 4-hydroxy-3-methylbut-2-enyl diphosphate reductase/30S ribosomal protein S1 [Desulfitobacterium sp.]|uniref:bifunctional 4-hydroxy-3-methylbut-2-enyl diphosphate reductase/30S ribosomal protein S1 n=1 Tax=Desulfitobacterium sp. TaxID=49981 RepID=UPI002B210697|nr:bifunctional 4-hydroxy-3-methylbut-2-enyl diphosphate reductase/30S ribosomal protein S1 [Desulfitobacterium sp.]MEA4902381.1 bifunctional 4-hydroxy-3-methylbut-2-enyl diphosphate reductase/30S ribosomal protein S1 [Desulfitobacterium sp.]
MEVIQAEKAGFCFGVKRALDRAERTVQNSATVSFGPLIHNQQVVDRLEKQGVRVIEAVDKVKPGETMIIRSHGVPPEIYQMAKERGIKVEDATCPFVQKAQKLAAEASLKSQVIVVGNKHHPEVQGILGWAGGNAFAIEKLEEAQELPFYQHLSVLAQTTQLHANFQRIVDELRHHTQELTVYNTICNATEERQTVARELAGKVDVMIVVGGKNSANTRKLASICSEQTQTYLIETEEELNENWFKGIQKAGLTAGASTPDWIIEEVKKKMSEIEEKDLVTQNDAEMNSNELSLENWADHMLKLHRGAVVTGTVVKMTHDEVYVDLGWKSEGVIELKELSAATITDPSEVVAIGDKIKTVVLRVENQEGNPVLSKRRVDEELASERLEQLAESKQELQAKVTGVVKGGLLVDVGMRGFVPASQIQIGYVADLKQFLGQTLRLRVIEFDPQRRKVVLSQKAILAEEQENNRKRIFETLQEGEIVTGTVQRLADFGAFIDIGGVDGLLHISEMSYSRIKHPSEIVKVGDEVEVQVLKVDREHSKISLGLKQLKKSPWESASEKYAVGTLVTGKVVRLVPFGAFVQLEDGIDGLIHISQLSEKRVAKVEDVVKVGDMVQAKVIECKPEEKRISLSIREAITEAQVAQEKEMLESQPDIPEVTIGDAFKKDSDQ